MKNNWKQTCQQKIKGTIFCPQVSLLKFLNFSISLPRLLFYNLPFLCFSHPPLRLKLLQKQIHLNWLIQKSRSLLTFLRRSQKKKLNAPRYKPLYLQPCILNFSHHLSCSQTPPYQRLIMPMLTLRMSTHQSNNPLKVNPFCSLIHADYLLTLHHP